jgi:uncharacterized protein (DUF1015 family)
MADVRPFGALRPGNDLAGRVIAPPYDVLTEEEARSLAKERHSFVRVTRSEVDLPPGSDPHSEEAYRKARENLDAFVSQGVLVEDEEPTYYLYGQTMGSHQQVGLLAACSVAEYDDGRIARHELTRPDKEDDRTHHMEVLDAQVGLVFLAYPAADAGALAAITARLTQKRPDWEVTTEDGVVHRLWVVPLGEREGIQEAFLQIPRLYIADGHHRSAAASRLHARRKDEKTAYFLAGLFPSDQLAVLAYNRVVHDLNGLDPDTFRQKLAETYELREDGRDTPGARGEVAMYLQGRWTTLVTRPGVRASDPVGALDVSVLQDRVLGPVLGIDDPRRSDRISFVGGIRGVSALQGAVDGGKAVAFHLFPTSLDELFVVADAGLVMPPKSTWFEPKLREGVAVRRV